MVAATLAGVDRVADFVALVGYGWFAVRHQFSHMDRLFFQNSWAGRQAVVWYLVGDYSRAASAYRGHFAGRLAKGAVAGKSAQEALLRGDVASAKKAAYSVLEQNPDDRGALLDMAEAALLENDTSHAIEYVGRVVAQRAEDPDALVLASLAAAHAGDYDHAIESLERTLRSSMVFSRVTLFFSLLDTMGTLHARPADRRPYALLAVYARYLRMYDPSNGRVAIRFANRAIANHDRPEEAYLTIGIVHDKEGRKGQALSAFQQAIGINPKFALGYWWASFAYGKIGDLSNEYLMAKAATDAASDDPFFGRHLTYVLMDKLGDIHQAVSYLRTAVVASPNQADVHHLLAYALDYVGNYDESVTEYRETIHLDPSAPTLYDDLARTLHRADRFEEAVETLREVNRRWPSRPTAHAQLGDFYMDHYRAVEAVSEYEMAERLGEFPQMLCKAYQIAARFNESADCFKRILRNEPGSQYAQRNLPEVLQAVAYQRVKRS